MAGGGYGPVIGPVLVGACFASLCCGILLQQTALYFLRYPRDAWIYKIIVFLLTSVSLISFGANINDLWFMAITSRGNDALLASGSPKIIATATPVFAATLNHVFFGIRVYRLTYGSKPLAIGLAFVILTCFGDGLALIIKDVHNHSVSGANVTKSQINLVLHLIESWLWVTAGVDLILSGILVWRLTRDRNDGSFNARTDSIVRQLLVVTISTALLTSIFATVAAIVTITTIEESNALIGFTIMLPHLYGLTVIGTLNLRTKIGAASGAKGPPHFGGRAHMSGFGSGAVSYTYDDGRTTRMTTTMSSSGVETINTGRGTNPSDDPTLVVATGSSGSGGGSSTDKWGNSKTFPPSPESLGVANAAQQKKEEEWRKERKRLDRLPASQRINWQASGQEPPRLPNEIHRDQEAQSQFSPQPPPILRVNPSFRMQHQQPQPRQPLSPPRNGESGWGSSVGSPRKGDVESQESPYPVFDANSEPGTAYPTSPDLALQSSMTRHPLLRGVNDQESPSNTR